MRLIDTHCHLDSDDLRDDLDSVLARAGEAGVERMVSVAVSASSAEFLVGMAAERAPVFAAVGVHPCYVHEAAACDWDRVLALVDRPKVVALGETGLDKHWNVAPIDLQQDYFDRHLRLSAATGLPFITHTRDCEPDVFAMLEAARARGPLTGVMHSFTGTPESAARCVEWGLYVSFAGMVTFKKSDDLRRTAASVPDDRILVETDSPYLSPHPLRGKRNEPANVVHTARVVAEARGVTLETLAEQTAANARRLFSRMT